MSEVKIVFLFDDYDVKNKFKNKALPEVKLPELPAAVIAVEEGDKVMSITPVDLEEQSKNFYTYCKKRRSAIQKRNKNKK